MQSRISKLRKLLTERKVKRKLLDKEQYRIEKSLGTLRRTVASTNKAIIVIEYIIEQNHDEIVDMFENTVSSGLQELFNEEYAFRLDMDRSGMNTTCEFQVITNECKRFRNIRMTQGKSVQEVIAALMRIVICSLDKQIMNVVWLDEPFSGLQVYRKEKAALFLNKICKELGMQLVIVTQTPEMGDYADLSINISKQTRLIL